LNKIAVLSVAIVALGAGIFLGTKQRGSDLSDLSGFSFPAPEKLQQIELIDHDRQALTEASFKDLWTFVYVGYTFCPDACPMAMTTLNQLSTLLDKEDNNAVNMLLVSVDPERDTPEHMKDFVKFFNRDFIAATGTDEAIRHFADQVSAVYSLPEDRSDPNYLVDHSSSVILINPDAAVQAVFTHPQKASEIAKDFELLVAHYQSQQ